MQIAYGAELQGPAVRARGKTQTRIFIHVQINQFLDLNSPENVSNCGSAAYSLAHDQGPIHRYILLSYARKTAAVKAEFFNWEAVYRPLYDTRHLFFDNVGDHWMVFFVISIIVEE